MKIDLIVKNAHVITMDPEHPSAHSFGVLHGAIVGFDSELEGLEASHTIDVNGFTVIPGIIDAHCHTPWFGRTLREVDLSTPDTLEEALQRLANHAAELSPDEWVVAAGYNQHRFSGAYPSIAQLDAVAGGRPLVIRQSSGHAAIANTRALALADIIDAPDPVGGVIERDIAGRVTGRLDETAQDLVLDLLKPYSSDDVVSAIALATAHYASEGITSFAEAGIGLGWIGHSPIELRAYQRARAMGLLKSRAQLMPTIDTLHELTGASSEHVGHGIDLGIATGFGDEMVHFGPVKIFVDGSLTGRTCAMTRPFAGEPDNYGMLLDDAPAIRLRMLEAAAAGWSIAAHAIGDRAIDLAIDVIAEAQHTYGMPASPHRIEHASYLRDEHLPLLREHTIAVTPQALFVRQFGDQFLSSLGEERAMKVYRAQSLLEAGVLVAGSSDRPCLDGNPFEAMRTLRERITLSGVVFGPHEVVSPYAALEMYTTAAAKAMGVSDRVGMLRTGMLADFVVLDRSPLTADPSELSDLSIRATYLGGTPVFSASPHEFELEGAPRS